MGKTTLVEAFVAEVAAAQTAWIGWGQCIDHSGAGEAYLPLLDALGRLGRGPAGARLGACVRQYAPTWLGPLAALVGEEERAAGGSQGPGVTPPQMLRELAAALEACTAVHPLILVLEDLHWSDASTVEALTLLARRREAARLLVLGTYRPVELILRQHPLKAVKQELQLHGLCADVPLGYLPAAAVQAYLAQRGPTAAATAEYAAWVHRRTEGHPLFMVHVVAELARGGGLTAAPAAAGRGAAAEVPAGLQQLIELQLGQLDAEEQQVLEVASVVGAEFAEASVAAGLPLPLDAIAARCEGLAQRGQFIEDRGLAAWPDGTVSGRYGFRHALYQEVLYRRMGSGRRMRCHRAIGMRLEAGYRARTHEVAAELALHCQRGQDAQRAVQYLGQAAENATQRQAPHEVIALLTTALALLATLPETLARAQQELPLQLTLAVALSEVKGQAAPEVAQTYARIRALCAQVGETPQLVQMLLGLHWFHLTREALSTAREVGEQLAQLAQRTARPADLLTAHSALGFTAFLLGDYGAAQTHCAQGIALIDPPTQRAQAVRYGYAPGVFCLSTAANTLWCLGFPARAGQRSQEALALAQALEHPRSLAFVHLLAIYLHQRRREVRAAQAQAEALLTLATAQGFPQYVGYGTFWRGWTLTRQGQQAAGLVQMHQGLDALVALESLVARPLCLVWLAEATGQAGDIDAGLRLHGRECLSER